MAHAEPTIRFLVGRTDANENNYLTKHSMKPILNTHVRLTFYIMIKTDDEIFIHYFIESAGTLLITFQF